MHITRRLALASMLAAPAVHAQTPEAALTRIRHTRTLRMGVVNGQPPYCYKDLASGAWTGFLVDMGRQIAGELDVAWQPVESTWGNAVLDIQAGKVDVFFGLAPTAQRALVVDFVHPLFSNAYCVIARQGCTPKTWADLDDPAIRIALELGSQYDTSAPILVPKATLLRLKTNNEALLAVQSGRADAQMIVVILGLVTLSKNPSAGHLLVPQPTYGATTSGAVAKETDTAWREWLDAWIDRQREAGALRAMLLGSLERLGVPAGSVPAQVVF